MGRLVLPTYEDENHETGLARFYSNNVEYTVLITGGVATPYPGMKGVTQDQIDSADVGSGLGGRAAFVGGRKYDVTSAEEAILVGEGYTVV